uniref:Headcase middle domain-containing protein n=1 Tax=Trichobilharzia regenti TaxID=157069 RepID=A0AA85IZB4_TRIRE|nr:unnamed protein product [Trichobilharzia regenti]
MTDIPKQCSLSTRTSTPTSTPTPTPGTTITASRLPHSSTYLTGINEDTRGESFHSIIDLQGVHQKQHNSSISTCAVPLNVCCVCADEDGLQSLHSEIFVVCASPGCKYSGPIHKKCLDHWDSCCDFYCQLLNNATSSILSQSSSSPIDINSPSSLSSSISNNFSFNTGNFDSPISKSFMEGLFRLYECPLCGQYTLYRSSINSKTGQTENISPSHRFTSVLCAIQYAAEKLNQHERLAHSSLQQDTSQLNSPFTLNQPVDHYLPTIGSMPNFNADEVKHQPASTFSQPFTGRSHSYAHPPPITNKFSDILRRFSLNREANDTTYLSAASKHSSSDTSSGYYSSQSTGDSSIDPSRRNSNNSYASLMLGITTAMKSPEEEKEDTMKLHEDNSIPWMMPTNQPLPRALIKTSTKSGPTKLSSETNPMNDLLQRPADLLLTSMPTESTSLSTASTRRRAGSSISFDETFDTSLDATIVNNPSSNNSNNAVNSHNDIRSNNNNNNSNNDTTSNANNHNTMSRPISVIGSRRHHSTSSTLSSTNTSNTTNTMNNNNNNSIVNNNNNNFKSSSAWTNESLTNKSRISHWHNNSNNNNSNNNNSTDTKGRKTVNTKGNIFLQRRDFNVFTKLPNYKQNAYFIQMDDDSCTGNEDTRAFLLAQLTNHRVSEVYCLACQQMLPVYDHFPVIDGIFFISPLCHRSTEGYRKGGGLRVTWHTNGIQNQSIPPPPQQQQSQQQQQQQANRTSNFNNTNNNNNNNNSTNTNNSNNNLISSTNDYQNINKIALKLLAPLKIMSPPPGCLGPRQQLNSVQHNNMINMITSDQNSLLSNSTSSSSVLSSSRYSSITTSTRQGRYLHALCMNCMHTEDLISNNKLGDVKCIRCKVCGKLWSVLGGDAGSKLSEGI